MIPVLPSSGKSSSAVLWSYKRVVLVDLNRFLIIPWLLGIAFLEEGHIALPLAVRQAIVANLEIRP